MKDNRVEMKHRHVVEIVLGLLAHASLPLKFWLYAFQTAVHLISDQCHWTEDSEQTP